MHSECDIFFRDSEIEVKIYTCILRSKEQVRMKKEVPQDGYKVQSSGCKQWFSAFCLCASPGGWLKHRLLGQTTTPT